MAPHIRLFGKALDGNVYRDLLQVEVGDLRKLLVS